jgi:hypothetical protein
MLYAYAARFDMTRNLKKILIFGEELNKANHAGKVYLCCEEIKKNRN